jgi:hypothetical protein
MPSLFTGDLVAGIIAVEGKSDQVKNKSFFMRGIDRRWDCE